MFTIHGTKKVRDRVKAPLSDPVEPPTTAMGNWYATALLWKPQLALFVNEATLISVLVPLAPARSLAQRFPVHLEAVLNGLGTDPRVVDGEGAAMANAQWAKTAGRSMTGMMTEFTFLAEAARDHDPGGDPVAMAVWLAGVPCSPLYDRHTFPDRELEALVSTHTPG